MKDLMPDFIQQIDWESFKEQRKVLYTVQEVFDTNSDKYWKLAGIVNVLNSLCDYAVDVGGINEEIVMIQESTQSIQVTFPCDPLVNTHYVVLNDQDVDSVLCILKPETMFEVKFVVKALESALDITISDIVIDHVGDFCFKLTVIYKDGFTGLIMKPSGLF